MISFRVLGSVDLHAPDRPAAATLLGKQGAIALLAYMAIEGDGKFHRRDRLVGLFWPESGQGHARANLRKSLHTMRAALGDVVETRGDEEIRLYPDAVWCDAAEFRSALRSGRGSRAMELYAGPLLDGFHVIGAAEYGRWQDDLRESLARDAAKAAIDLADRHVQELERTEAGDLIRFIVRIGAGLSDEYLFRKLLGLLDRLGDKAGALALYGQFKERLARDFDAVPSRETRELIEQIRLH